MGVHKDDWLRLAKKFRAKPLIDTSPVVEEMQIRDETFLSVRRSYLGRDFWREYGGMLFMAILLPGYWNRGPVLFCVLVFLLSVIFFQHFLRVGQMACLPGGRLRIRYGRWPFCREVILDAEQLHCCETLVPFHKRSKKESGKLAFVLTHRSYPDTAVRIAAYAKREEMEEILHLLRRLTGQSSRDAASAELGETGFSAARIDRVAKRCSWAANSFAIDNDGIAAAKCASIHPALLVLLAVLYFLFIHTTVFRSVGDLSLLIFLDVAGPCVGAVFFVAMRRWLGKADCVFNGNSRTIALGSCDTLPDGARELTFEDVRAVQLCSWYADNCRSANYEMNLIVRYHPWPRVTVMVIVDKVRAYENSRRLAEHLGVEFLDHTLAEK